MESTIMGYTGFRDPFMEIMGLHGGYIGVILG